MEFLGDNFNVTEEDLQTIEDLAGVGYSPEKIAKYLSVEKEVFLKVWYVVGSYVREAYDRGRLKSEFLVLSQQKELAAGGNITAAQMFLKEKEKQEIENIRRQCLFQE